MAFAFERGEPVDVGAVRLARDGAERVLRALDHERQRGDEDASHERAIHDARRTLKRLRALVRLLRGALGDHARAANALLRDAGRSVSAARDAAVMLRTFDAIAGDDQHAPAIRASLRRARTRAGHDGDHRSDAAALVRAFLANVDQWQVRERGFEALAPGVRRTYRAARRALHDARAASAAEVLHELRKRTKDLQFELTLLRESFPEVLSGYVDALSTLGELLGDDHDLAVLGAALSRRRTLDVAAFVSRIEGRRAELHARILPLAEKIFFDRTSAWMARLETYYRL